MGDYDREIGVGVIVLILVGVAIGIPMSMGKVDATEVAFRQNRFTGVVDFDNVYTVGLHWNGFNWRFIKFDISARTIDFAQEDGDEYQLTSRTKDGLAISLEVSFQYKLQVDNVAELYVEYLNEYEMQYVRVARDALRDAVSLYTAIEFFNNRTVIGDYMEEVLTEELAVYYADVVALQLRRVDLPDTFEAALENVEVARQDYEVALREQEAAVVRAETSIIEAEALAQINIIEASANAESLIIYTSAVAEALNITIVAEADALYALQQTLGLNNTELLTYLWIKAVTEHDSSMLIIGESTPEILVAVD